MRSLKEKKKIISILSGNLTKIDSSSVKSAVSDIVNFSSRVLGVTPVRNYYSKTLWTRGDGATYRELNCLTYDSMGDVVWENICRVEGAKKGFIHGEFKSDHMIKAVRIGKVFFCVKPYCRFYTGFHIYYGSVSRLNKKCSNIHSWVDKSWD